MVHFGVLYISGQRWGTQTSWGPGWLTPLSHPLDEPGVMCQLMLVS